MNSPMFKASDTAGASPAASAPWCPMVTSPATIVLARRKSPRMTVMLIVRTNLAQKFGSRFARDVPYLGECVLNGLHRALRPPEYACDPDD